jgi:hypothetical protein
MTFAGLSAIFTTPSGPDMIRSKTCSKLTRLSLVIGALLFAPGGAIGAQSAIGEMRRQATRPELEKAAKAAEEAAVSAPTEKLRSQRRADAMAIQMRLANGDFIPGDRILLEVEGDSTLTDTFTVRGDRKLPLPNIADVSLQGVLDSELEPHLTKELLRYIKQVNLKATPLVRISMVGFPKSDFLTVPVDQAITDVITAAGGWGSTTVAAHEKTVVRRAGAVIMGEKAVAEAIRQAKTVGDMALRDGDEIYLPDRASGMSWQKVAGVLSGAVGLIWMIRYGLGG